MTNKKSFILSTVLIMTVSMGSSYAEDADMTQARSQDRVRAELKASDVGNVMSRMRVRNMEQQKQVPNEHRYRHNYQIRQNYSAADSVGRGHMLNRSNRKMR